MNKQDILNSLGRVKTLPVEVPEWGGTYHVRQLTLAERSVVQAGVPKDRDSDPDAQAAFTVKVVSLVLCDESGKRMFGDDEADKLRDAPATALDRVVLAANSLNIIADKENAKNG